VIVNSLKMNIISFVSGRHVNSRPMIGLNMKISSETGKYIYRFFHLINARMYEDVKKEKISCQMIETHVHGLMESPSSTLSPRGENLLKDFATVSNCYVLRTSPTRANEICDEWRDSTNLSSSLFVRLDHIFPLLFLEKTVHHASSPRKFCRRF